jgi:heat shock protein beta
VGKYSEFITHPIYIYASKDVDEEVPVEEDDEVANEDAEDETDADDDDDSDEDDTPKTKTVSKTVWDWELLNDSKAIWLRSSSDVDDAEYTKFYKGTYCISQIPPTV